MVTAVTAAEPPKSNSNPKSFSCRKLRTISCFDIPPKARPKPKNNPPINTTKFFIFKVKPPDSE